MITVTVEHVHVNVFNRSVTTTPIVQPVAPPAAQRREAEQHGGLAVLELTGWCALVLVVVNSAVGVAALTLPPLREAVGSLGVVLAVASWIAVVPVLVVGWPLGVMTAWALQREPREGLHVLVFAVVGAVAAVVLGLVGRTLAPDALVTLLLAVEGALGAGGGRFLLGRARHARAGRRAWRQATDAGTVTP